MSLSTKIALWYGVTFFFSALLFANIINVIFEQSYTLPSESVKDALIAYGINPEDVANDPNIQREIANIRTEIVADIRPRVNITLLVFSLTAILIGFLVSKKLLKPIKDLNKTIRNINENELKTRIAYYRQKDELGDLIINFNTMLDRLDESFKLQKQFIEDASHELKTPLTIIKSNSESALLRKTISKQELKDSIKKNVDAVNRLSKMISTLLNIAKANTGDISFHRLDLVHSIQETISDIQPLSKEKRISINLVSQEKYVTLGNKALLSKVWFNILENVIIYSNPETKVLVTISKKGSGILIKFKDEGIGIDSKRQKYIFKRFYRVGASSSKSVRGSGLGLSIVKSIVNLHHGEVNVSSEVNKGSTFSVLLPNAK